MEINYSVLIHQTRYKSSLIENSMLGTSTKKPVGFKSHLNVHSIAVKMKENYMYIQTEDGRKLPLLKVIHAHHAFILSLSAWWLDVRICLLYVLKGSAFTVAKRKMVLFPINTFNKMVKAFKKPLKGNSNDTRLYFSVYIC